MNESPKRNVITALILVLLGGPAGAGATEGSKDHDKEYWREVVANDFAAPENVPLAVLLEELSTNLSSTDPELRDDISYGILTQWLYVKKIVPPELRRDLTSEWIGNLQRSIGERNTDSVILRSFSALMLSVIAASDDETPYLDRDEFKALLDAAVGYMHDEQDTRGFDADTGWLHSVAHTADFMKFLARSRHLEVSEQSIILSSINDKLDSVSHVLDRGEDERLARAVLSLVARPDFDSSAFETFVRRLQPLSVKGLPTSGQLAVNQNRRNIAVSLYAVLATDRRDLDHRRIVNEMLLGFLDTIM
jgi:hypothetical protein